MPRYGTPKYDEPHPLPASTFRRMRLPMQIPAQIHLANPEIDLRVWHQQYNTGYRFTVLTHQHHAGLHHTRTSGR